MPAPAVRIVLVLLAMLFAVPAFAEAGLLPDSPELYQDQTQRVRRLVDRPWDPEAGQLGNLRMLHIRADDCAVRIVSGSENRVFPGTRKVYVVENSRVLDDDPDETPAPRDVILAPEVGQACAGMGSCGVSTAWATRAPGTGSGDAACFTVQLASAHYLLLDGDNLVLLADRVRQPWLRIAVNPGPNVRLWFEDVDIGAMTFSVNAPVRIGGTGRVDYLGGSSSNGGSAMYLHEFDAPHVGVSTTTTGTQWSVRTGKDIDASYYQPARAPGKLAEGYTIEIDGPLDLLEVPASRVNPVPLRESTRAAARALRDDVLRRVGPTPTLHSDGNWPTPAEAIARLPSDARDHVVKVLSRYLPATTRITHVTLPKPGEGRIEGFAPDHAAVDEIARRLTASGEFVHVRTGSTRAAEKDGQPFAADMYFSCDVPGQPSVCPAGDPRAKGAYSEMQVIEFFEALLGPNVTLHDARLEGRNIFVEAYSASESEAKAALERIGAQKGFFRTSHTGIGPDRNRPLTNIRAKLELTCPRPPTMDGICSIRSSAQPPSDGPE